MPEAPPGGASLITTRELVEPELAAPGAAPPARDAGAVAARSAQQVLDAVAQAVSSEGPASSSALAPIEEPRPDIAVADAGSMVPAGAKHRRSALAGSHEPDEQAVLDDIASASDDLELAAGGPGAAPEPVEQGAWTPQASAPGELYEGTVRLLVMADGNVQRIVQFVDELCQMPQFRMLRMTGSRKQDGAEISLGLREPLPFAKIVGSMPNVVRVEVPSPDEDVADGGIGLTVYLAPGTGDDLDLALIEPPFEPEA